MRYIELSDQILDLEKMARIYRDPNMEGRIWWVIPGEPDTPLDGEDAIKVWRLFAEEVGWR